MKLTNKNILLISPEPWDHIFVSKHHYATHLAKRGNHVFFLNPPSTNFSCTKTEQENVHSVHYQGLIKGLRFFPSFLQKVFIKKKFKALERLCGVHFDIVWSFDNSVFFDFSAFPEGVFGISHIVDLNQNFAFEKATKTADVCLSTSRFIESKQKIYNQDSFNIGHGYNPLSDGGSFKLLGKNTIKCGYAGNLDITYLDWSLIIKLIQSNPKVDFHFAGTWKNPSNELLGFTNFHYAGIVPSRQLKGFYQANDVLIIAYQSDTFKEQLANPHKMMEYLGSGKMVLATWTEEYSKIEKKGYISMSRSKDEFLRSFKEIVNSLSHWNNKDLSDFRIAFALKNRYTKQIEKIEQILIQISNT